MNGRRAAGAPESRALDRLPRLEGAGYPRTSRGAPVDQGVPDLRVDFRRLQADLEELAAIERRDDHGIHRMAFSDDDMHAPLARGRDP